MTNQQHLLYFRLDYVNHGQAPDALLERAVHDVQENFLEPDKYLFTAIYDEYPDEEDVEDIPDNCIRVLVTVTTRQIGWKDRMLYLWHYVLRR